MHHSPKGYVQLLELFQTHTQKKVIATNSSLPVEEGNFVIRVRWLVSLLQGIKGQRTNSSSPPIGRRYFQWNWFYCFIQKEFVQTYITRNNAGMSFPKINKLHFIWVTRLYINKYTITHTYTCKHLSSFWQASVQWL